MRFGGGSIPARDHQEKRVAVVGQFQLNTIRKIDTMVGQFWLNTMRRREMWWWVNSGSIPSRETKHVIRHLSEKVECGDAHCSKFATGVVEVMGGGKNKRHRSEKSQSWKCQSWRSQKLELNKQKLRL